MCHCFPSGERRWFGRDTVATSYFNPRSPCGERLEAALELRCARQISIHASRVGSDVVTTKIIPETFGFQSTLPVWGATSAHDRPTKKDLNFNPRSPCGERRVARLRAYVHLTYFNPRSPCGERRRPGSHRRRRQNFNPRSPCGERPSRFPPPAPPPDFNPRSPCGERPGRPGWCQKHTDFNPRSPCGERRRTATGTSGGSDFNPRSPCGERRRSTPIPFKPSRISIHAPRVGSDRRLRLS